MYTASQMCGHTSPVMIYSLFSLITHMWNYVENKKSEITQNMLYILEPYFALIFPLYTPHSFDELQNTVTWIAF